MDEAMPKKNIGLVITAYLLSLLPFLLWIVWPVVFGNNLDATYRTTFGILIVLPVAALVLSVYGVVRLRKFIKIALIPAVPFAIFVALLCYSLSVLTLD